MDVSSSWQLSSDHWSFVFFLKTDCVKTSYLFVMLTNRDILRPLFAIICLKASAPAIVWSVFNAYEISVITWQLLSPTIIQIESVYRLFFKKATKNKPKVSKVSPRTWFLSRTYKGEVLYSKSYLYKASTIYFSKFCFAFVFDSLYFYFEKKCSSENYILMAHKRPYSLCCKCEEKC